MIDGYAEVNGTRIAYFDHGQGTPVVLAHSLFFDHSMFDALVELLIDAGYRTITYDHRGQGTSRREPRADLSVDILAEDAARLIDHLNVAPCHFVGNSLGGMVALRLAARRPHLLRSAAALGASADREYRLAEFVPLAAHLSEHGPADIVDQLMFIMFGDTSLANPDSTTISSWRTYLTQLDPSIGDAAYGVIYRHGILEELHGCQIPVLAIAGTEDHAYPPPISTTKIANAAGGRSVTIPEAGHSVALERPKEVFQALMAHFTADRR
ncbi:3-oxoadipate enol-lactonase [Nocardia sp. GAS34]|uniref:alpha/beta fold hydrolase n=1 Tax=unclassified Nocardia TaxID=2637762 RepID=UPI003D1CC93D